MRIDQVEQYRNILQIPLVQPKEKQSYVSE